MLCYQLKVTDSRFTRCIMCLLIIQWQCQRNDRCQTGRGPIILVLRFNGEFAFEEILTLLRLLQLLLLPLFLPLTFSLCFFDTFLCPLPHHSPFSLLCLLLQPWSQLLRRQRKDPQDAGWGPGEWSHMPGHNGIVLGIFSSPWGCQTWHVPFLVTIHPVFRFSKNSSISPHVTGCTCASLFC